MLVIGLTGSIGSGKSETASRFAEYGVPIIDADAIAHELVNPGEPALEEIVHHFGEEILTTEGVLDRARLRQKVFSDSTLRQQLEAILHPQIRVTIKERIKSLDAPYCIIVIPLLVETAQQDLVDRVLVVESPLELCYKRLAKRDGASQAEVDQILATQANFSARIAVADDVISNNGSWDRLYGQIELLHLRYLALAQGS